MGSLKLIDILVLGVPILLVGLPYYLLIRYRKPSLSGAVHLAFRITLAVQLVWAAMTLWTVGTGDGWSRLALLGWLVQVVPVSAAVMVVTWSIARLVLVKDGAPSAGRYVAGTVLVVGALITVAVLYREHALLGKAKNVNASEAELRALSSSVLAGHDRKTLEAIAFNSATPADVLERLARHPEYTVRMQVCNNRQTPAHVLEILSHDEVLYTKPCVAHHPNASPELLARLALDKNFDVRYRAAQNPATPEKSLRMLARESNELLRRGMAGNPALPPDVVQAFSKDEDEVVRGYAVRHSNATRAIRLKGATDPSKQVRQAALTASGDDPEILDILSRDEDRNIRYSAKYRLEHRHDSDKR